MPRATPMSAEDRRCALVEATRPLLYEHGRAVTTRLIAESAGVAEGTIFRHFSSKEELIEAVLEREFDPAPFLELMKGIDPGLPLQERLVLATAALQARFRRIFSLMIALALPKPPERFRSHEMRRRIGEDGLRGVVLPDAERFRVPPEEVVRLLRLLTFSGSHPHLSEQPFTPEEIVEVILHGTLRAAADDAEAEAEGES